MNFINNQASFIRNLGKVILFTGSLVFFSASALAAPPINTLKNSFWGGRTDTAISGYDTVAYFTEDKAVKGKDEFFTQWKGAKWKFANQKHLDLFRGSPEKYAPQYGGYCAYGVANDYLVKIEPAQFTIIKGKLYLNYDKSVQKDWAKDPQGFIKTADAKFAKLLKSEK